VNDIEKRNADLESRLAASRDLNKNLSLKNNKLIDDVLSLKETQQKHLALIHKAYWDGFFAKDKNISTPQNAIQHIAIISDNPFDIVREIREIKRFPSSVRIKSTGHSLMLNTSHDAWLFTFAFFAGVELNKITSEKVE
jgi:hypothetical protein